MGTGGSTAHGPQTRAGIGAGGSMHFLGAGDYLGASCFQHDPPWWNPPFPPPMHGVLTEDEWSNFFRGLNMASSLNIDRQCGCCLQAFGGIAGAGWMSGVKAFLEQENAKMGGRVQWSYERHLNGESTVYNRLDVSWQTMAATPVAISMGRCEGIAEEIAKLNDLKEKGVLSSTQFEVAKAIVLGT